MARKKTHPWIHKFDSETRARIMIDHLEAQARKLQHFGYDPKPAVSWLNEILPLLRLMKYDEKRAWSRTTPPPEDEIQKQWEEFIVMFLDDISGIRE
jgi:hypothetical protein